MRAGGAQAPTLEGTKQEKPADGPRWSRWQRAGDPFSSARKRHQALDQHFRTLELPNTASPDARKAYRRLARKYHPDKDSSDTVDLFRVVNEACEVLMDLFS